jgi:hypothetical protein
VRSGARTLLRRPLLRARIDGRRAPSERDARRFTAGSTALLGYRVGVRVPGGAHTIVLRAALSRGA